MEVQQPTSVNQLHRSAVLLKEAHLSSKSICVWLKMLGDIFYETSVAEIPSNVNQARMPSALDTEFPSMRDFSRFKCRLSWKPVTLPHKFHNKRRNWQVHYVIECFAAGSLNKIVLWTLPEIDKKIFKKVAVESIVNVKWSLKSGVALLLVWRSIKKKILKTNPQFRFADCWLLVSLKDAPKAICVINKPVAHFKSDFVYSGTFNGENSGSEWYTVT